MAALVISPSEYGSFKSSTHKGHSLQGRKSPVNNNHRRNSTNSSKSLSSPPHNNRSEPVSPSMTLKTTSDSSPRKLERAASEPADRRSSASSQSSNSSRYKTELCRPFEENGSCKYGDKCQFAHGMKELRTLSRHPKYKTELCRSFHTTGLCPYGPRCHFIHNSEQPKGAIFNGSSSNSRPTPSRPKALSSSSLGSTGDLSPPSSLSGSPTMIGSTEDFFQYPSSPSSFPFAPDHLQGGFMEYTTHEFNPDYYDTNNIFQERILNSVFGSSSSSSSSDGLDVDPSSLCGSPTLELFTNTPTSSPGFASYPVFNLFGKPER